MAKLAPVFNDAQLIDGMPATGGLLFTYTAGSSTKQSTFTDEDGTTPQSNPIVLNARGEPDSPIWLTEGLSYKFVFAPSDDTDPPSSAIRTFDDVSGINDASVALDQWIDPGLTPTYVNATQFTLSGDQTTNFHVNRRVKLTVTAGTVYGYISVSAYTSLTTITVVLDSGTLDAGLSAVQLGLLTATNDSIPNTFAKKGTIGTDTTVTADITMSGAIIKLAKGADVASATALPLITDGNYFDVTGTTTITSFNSVGVGSVVKLHFDDALTLTHHATDLILPDGEDIITAAGDEAEFVEYASGDFRCTNYQRAATPRALTPLTPQATTSGTTKDFTIPSGASIVVIHFDGVSTNSTSAKAIQLGDSGGVETTGYNSAAGVIGGSPTTSTAALIVTDASVAARAESGHITLTLMDPSTNKWTMSGSLYQVGFAALYISAGIKSLSGELTTVRITSLSGDTFDAGSANVSYG